MKRSLMGFRRHYTRRVLATAATTQPVNSRASQDVGTRRPVPIGDIAAIDRAYYKEPGFSLEV